MTAYNDATQGVSLILTMPQILDGPLPYALEKKALAATRSALMQYG